MGAPSAASPLRTTRHSLSSLTSAASPAAAAAAPPPRLQLALAHAESDDDVVQVGVVGGAEAGAAAAAAVAEWVCDLVTAVENGWKSIRHLRRRSVGAPKGDPAADKKTRKPRKAGGGADAAGGVGEAPHGLDELPALPDLAAVDGAAAGGAAAGGAGGVAAGVDVEVEQLEEGFAGSRYLATVLAPAQGGATLVQYLAFSESEESDDRLKEWVPSDRLRPLPPPPPEGWLASVTIGDEVEMLFEEGWWRSAVVRTPADQPPHLYAYGAAFPYSVEAAGGFAQFGVRDVPADNLRPVWLWEPPSAWHFALRAGSWSLDLAEAPPAADAESDAAEDLVREAEEAVEEAAAEDAAAEDEPEPEEVEEDPKPVYVDLSDSDEGEEGEEEAVPAPAAEEAAAEAAAAEEAAAEDSLDFIDERSPAQAADCGGGGAGGVAGGGGRGAGGGRGGGGGGGGARAR